MTPHEATDLAKRIINTMRPTPALREWVEILQPLDPITAAATFRYFRTATADGLAIATFRAQYDRFEVGAARTARAGEPDDNCTSCRGTGYTDGPPITHDNNGRAHAHPYTTVQPCTCTSRRNTP